MYNGNFFFPIARKEAINEKIKREKYRAHRTADGAASFNFLLSSLILRRRIS